MDAEGRVVSATLTESRFTPVEVARLLASRRSERVKRGSHGRELSETTDPANQWAYRVPDPTVDFAEKALAAKQDEYLKRYPNAPRSALLWRVEKKD